MNILSRKEHLAEKIVFVDGLPGCGKTLFSTLISSMGRVELLSYTYEVEHMCSLYYLEKISMDAAKTMVRIQTDLKIYNTMMGRDVNFRPTDLSSVFKNHNPSRYLQRLFDSGDEKVPEMIQQENPILNFSVHNLLSYSEPIWQALGGRCVFIEVVRHPLYMVRQQALNMRHLLGNVRHFTVYYAYQGHELPYYIYGWEKDYLNSNPMGRAIHFIDKLTHRTKKARKKLKEKYPAKIITIPFEKFVLNPEPWVQKIADALGTNILDSTRKVMSEQNIPRNMVADGIDIEIYKRCGWVPTQEGTTERDELEIRREDVVKELNSELISVLDRLSSEYEQEFWNPDEHN
jgi:hypothetical protein